MKIWLMAVGLVLTVLSFQNCGTPLPNEGNILGVGGDIDSLSSGDGSVNDSLFAKIKDANPVTVNLRYNPIGFPSVGGTCGTGGFTNHFFQWELRRGSGNQEVVGSGRFESLCNVGRFSMVLPVNLGPLQVDPQDATKFVAVRYSLTIEILGLDENLNPVSSPLTTSVSSVDIVALNEDSQALGSELSPALQFCRQTQIQRVQAGLDPPNTPDCPLFSNQQLFGPDFVDPAAGVNNNGAVVQ